MKNYMFFWTSILDGFRVGFGRVLGGQNRWFSHFFHYLFDANFRVQVGRAFWRPKRWPWQITWLCWDGIGEWRRPFGYAKSAASAEEHVTVPYAGPSLAGCGGFEIFKLGIESSEMAGTRPETIQTRPKPSKNNPKTSETVRNRPKTMQKRSETVRNRPKTKMGCEIYSEAR